MRKGWKTGISVGKPEVGERSRNGQNFCVERFAFMSLAAGASFDDAKILPTLGDEV